MYIYVQESQRFWDFVRIWVLSEKVSFWLFKIFEIQKGCTFSFNDILRLCTIVVKERLVGEGVVRGGRTRPG